MGVLLGVILVILLITMDGVRNKLKRVCDGKYT